MSGEIDLRTGFLFSENGATETVTLEKLNRLVTELVLRVMAGAITERELADGSITADKLAADISAQLGVSDGSVSTAKIVDDAVTNAKLAEMPALSVKGNPANVGGNPQDIAASGSGFLYCDGSTISFRALPISDPVDLFNNYAAPMELSSPWSQKISTTKATTVYVSFLNSSLLFWSGINIYLSANGSTWRQLGQAQHPAWGGLAGGPSQSVMFTINVPANHYLKLEKNSLSANPKILQITYQTIG